MLSVSIDPWVSMVRSRNPQFWDSSSPGTGSAKAWATLVVKIVCHWLYSFSSWTSCFFNTAKSQCSLHRWRWRKLGLTERLTSWGAKSIMWEHTAINEPSWLISSDPLGSFWLLLKVWAEVSCCGDSLCLGRACSNASSCIGLCYLLILKK